MVKPHTLLDTLKQLHNFKSDRALAQLLDIEAPYLSRIRGGKLAVGPTVILAIHEKTGMPVAQIRSLCQE